MFGIGDNLKETWNRLLSNYQFLTLKFAEIQVKYVDHEVQPVFDLVVLNTTEWILVLEWG